MQTVNIGILAHVDAGKTSLTERLLFDTGVIESLGSVNDGTTQTDSGELERRRGITIRSAVAAFRIGGRQVNLVDTPGHSDFVAEVERAISVLDGAVLVLSAVEGVQPHTRVLMKTLRSLRMPTLIFVNKIDRMGARAETLLADIARLLTPAIAPMGTVESIGTPQADFVSHPVTSLAPALAEQDEGLLETLVDGIEPKPEHVMSVLREQVAAATIYPVLFGSALSGSGVPALLRAIQDVLPASPPAEARLRGRVFAIERGSSGEKVAYLRSYGGDLHKRQRVTIFRSEPEGRVSQHRAQVTDLHVVGAEEGVLTAGFIAKVHGLASARIGDQIGSAEGLESGGYFRPPSLETVVKPRNAKQSDALHSALVNLADEDPLIGTRVASTGQTSVLLYGEVQKEIIAATLANVYGIDAIFEPSQVMHLERPVSTGHALELVGNGFPATVGLRVEPGDGVVYRIEVEYGILPLSFHKAIEDTVFLALEQGVYGWPVRDVTVTLTHSGYQPPTTAAGHFRQLTPLVLAQALAMAGSRVFEPCHRFEVEVPPERLGTTIAHLAQLGARIDATTETKVTGEIVARLVHGFQQRLPDLSHGEGMWSSAPQGDRAVTGRPQRRQRTDGNPFDRAEYLRFLSRVVTARP